MGQGKEATTVYHRQVEDPRPPFVFGGPFNADVHESTFVKLNEAFAQERLIDALLFPGYLKELDGLTIRPGSGLSSRAAVLYGQWAREAVRRAGRPGLAICGHAVMALNEIACTSEEWGLRQSDPRAMVLISELQVDDVTMSRTMYYQGYGCPIYMAFTPLVGGYGGGPDGTRDRRRRILHRLDHDGRRDRAHRAAAHQVQAADQQPLACSWAAWRTRQWRATATSLPPPATRRRAGQARTSTRTSSRRWRWPWCPAAAT